MKYFMKQKMHIYAMNRCFLSTSRTKLIRFLVFMMAIKAGFHKKWSKISEIKEILNCKIRLNLFILHKVIILPCICKFMRLMIL